MNLFNSKPHSQFLDDGKAIQDALLKAISNAGSSISVAVAWFTDQQLLDALVAKANAGVEVKLVIADNDTNNLDYEALLASGGQVKRIKGNGFGIMHNKYAIFDGKEVFHGSYNWTNNAAKNNSESVVSTTDPKLISDFEENYKKLFNEERSPSSVQKTETLETAGGVFQVSDEEDINFLQTLDKITLGWTSDFNEESVIRKGFEAASTCNGNSDQVPNVLDTLLHDYRMEVSANVDGKARLIDNLDIILAHHSDRLRERSNIEKENLKKEADTADHLLNSQKEELKKQRDDVNEQLLSTRNEIQKVTEEKTRLDTGILELKENLQVTAVKWYQFWPVVVLSCVMLVYLFTFYSSAMYILIQAKNDAVRLADSELPIELPEVYDPNAWIKALEIGGTLPWYCAIAVIVPVCLSLLKLFVRRKWLGELASWLLAIVAVDFLIAYKITETIQYIRYLAGDSLEQTLTINEMLQNADFYLVFMLGALPLMIFKYMIENLRNQLTDSNLDDQRNKMRAGIDKIKRQQKPHLQQIIELAGLVEQQQFKIESIESKIETIEESLRQNVTELESQVSALTEKEHRRITNAERIHKIYKSNVTENHFKITSEMLQGRIAAVMEGWKKYLFGFYSDAVARERMKLAMDAKMSWWSDNFKSI